MLRGNMLVHEIRELGTFSYEREVSWQHPPELALNWKRMVKGVSVEVKQNGYKRMTHTDITLGRETVQEAWEWKNVE